MKKLETLMFVSRRGERDIGIICTRALGFSYPLATKSNASNGCIRYLSPLLRPLIETYTKLIYS